MNAATLLQSDVLTAQTSRVQPSSVPDNTPWFARTGFEIFGQVNTKVPQIYVLGDNQLSAAASWVSRRELAGKSDAEKWTDLVSKRHGLFASYQVIRLHKPSLVLPAGNVAFSVIDDPINLADSPKGTRVGHRLVEAIMSQHGCRLHYLEPVFQLSDSGPPVPMTTAVIRQREQEQRAAVFANAARFGWYYRYQHMVTRQLRRVNLWFERKALMAEIARLQERIKSRRSEGWIIRHEYSETVMKLETLNRRCKALGLEEGVESIRQAKVTIRSLRRIDPILTFTYPNRDAGLHFLIAHWGDYRCKDGQVRYHVHT